MYVKKTLGFSDVRVINKLEEIKFNGGNLSQYVTQLILQDVEREENKYTIEDLIEVVKAATQNGNSSDSKIQSRAGNGSFNISEMMRSAMDID